MKIGIFTCGLVFSFLLSLSAGEVLTVEDAFESSRTLNPSDRISAVIYSTPALQDRTRSAGKVLDGFLARDDFQFIVLVDLRGTLANWASGYTRRRMQRDLKAKINNLSPEIANFNNGEWPRPDISVVPDFDGKICRQLDWNEPSSDMLRVIVFKNGKEFRRWDNLVDHGSLKKAVKGLLNE